MAEQVNDGKKYTEEEESDEDVPAQNTGDKSNLRPLISDDEDSDGSGDENITEKSKHRSLISDDEDLDESNDEKAVGEKPKQRPLISDDESSDESEDEKATEEKSKQRPLISDDDENSDESDKEKVTEKSAAPVVSGDESGSSSDENEGGQEESPDEDEERPQLQNNTIYDFDIMMAKKKEENSKKRRRRNYDIINDNDDIINDMINQMRDAMEADIEANKNRQAATNKLKLLPFINSQLIKVDLRDAFLDSDVLSVITEWLTPLPDRSLPHLTIRESLLKILIDFSISDVERIKASGIGKAVMYLYKHPKETRENKQRAKRLISCWSRPVFNLDTNFSSISREEREQRDLDLRSKQRRALSQGSDLDDEDKVGPSKPAKKPKEDQGAQKPGEKGWIPRARVPAPSTRDYVVRPRSKVDGDIGKCGKRPANILEKLMRTHQERRRANKQTRAISMNIDRG